MIGDEPEVTTSGTSDNREWPAWQLYPPPEGDPGVGKWVWQKYETMLKYRDSLGMPKLWISFNDLYRGKFFKGRPKYTKNVANLIFKAINSAKAHLTDNKPQADIQPRGETSEDAAKIWSAAYDEWWARTQQQLKLQKSVGKSELYGFQTDKMIFDPSLEGGMGEVDTIRCDTFGVLFWPGTEDLHKTPMVVHFEAVELGEIYRTWPESEGKVKGDAKYSELLGEDRNQVRAAPKTDNIRPIGAPSGYVMADEDKSFPFDQASIQKALVVELWVRDYTMVSVDPRTGEEVPEGTIIEDAVADQQAGVTVATQVPPVKQAKYPGFIRCIHVTNNGNLVLSDVPNPSINPVLPREVTSKSYLFDKFPFIRRFSYDDDLSEFGISVIEQIANLAVEVSKKISQISTHLDYSTRPVLILPQSSGVRKTDVNNLPNRIWEPLLAMATHIRYLPMPSLPPDYLAFIELLMRLIDIITGLTDVSEGRKPAGITAGVAIAALQEKAQTIIRDKIRNLDIYVAEQGRMYVSLAQNWYSEERMLIYEDDRGDKQNVRFVGIEAAYQGEVAFDVEAGSTLPNNRWATREQTMQLFKIGVIDQRAVLEEFNVRNRDQIIQRMQAGPLQMALEKLKNTGLYDDATLQSIGHILSMPDNEFKQAFPSSQNPFAMAASTD